MKTLSLTVISLACSFASALLAQNEHIPPCYASGGHIASICYVGRRLVHLIGDGTAHRVQRAIFTWNLLILIIFSFTISPMAPCKLAI